MTASGAALKTRWIQSKCLATDTDQTTTGHRISRSCLLSSLCHKFPLPRMYTLQLRHPIRKDTADQTSSPCTRHWIYCSDRNKAARRKEQKGRVGIHESEIIHFIRSVNVSYCMTNPVWCSLRVDKTHLACHDYFPNEKRRNEKRRNGETISEICASVNA